MKVLSLFDGCAMAYEALNRAGISVGTYYASEIDKYAIKIANKNHSDIIQVGDITKLDAEDFIDIDLIIGGSPCQDLSKAGKSAGLSGDRSSLFYEYARLLYKIKPKYFILENVKMKDLYEQAISKILQVQPIEINSNLFSAQNRKRLYWTNIPHITMPDNKQTYFGDIKEDVQDRSLYYSDKALKLIAYWSKKFHPLRVFSSTDIMPTIMAGFFRTYSKQHLWAVDDVHGFRFFTPLECERAQTLTDNYTEGVSRTQRYKMIGNGFTVDVIAHILSHI